MCNAEIALTVSNAFWAAFAVYCYYKWGKTLEAGYEILEEWQNSIKEIANISDEMKQSS